MFHEAKIAHNKLYLGSTEESVKEPNQASGMIVEGSSSIREGMC